MVSSSSAPSLQVKIPATGEGKLTINVKSPTSEMYAEVKQADKVKDLEKVIKKAWGDDYLDLYYKSIKMKSDQPLSFYNLRDGSIVRVSLLAEPPHESKSSRENKKHAKLQLERRSSTSTNSINGGNGCGNVVFHMAKMLSQFCSSIFPSH
ncbi:uncharacterized protein LOC107775024 [Nicotiana tabacum]|uniref:Uncharacterized protein LOC107775024 n=2 Tax=Nicotiana TaxID=4085 RepID=A0A1S3YDG8_TOBAC|nr:PREDICTED: uncharacterized protein LOC104210209 [Nicotiana sylvestris]XP_016450179.1 PREDICTED: uncharacterized protein LOC107775024 isoform X1 [Nicotiana tabacum]